MCGALGILFTYTVICARNARSYGFFFLSGYLITTLLRFEFEKNHFIDLKRFYLKRSIRILPPLYLLLALSVVLQLSHLLGTFHVHGLVAESLFFTNYWMILDKPGLAPGLDVLWSLAVEEHFYLIFPLLYIFLSKRFSPEKQASILSVFCAVILCWRFFLHYALHSSILRTRLASDTRIDSMLFGCIMAIVANPIAGDRLSAKLQRQLSWIAPASMILLLFDALWHNVGFRETIRYSLDGAALFGCFTYAITATKSAAFRFLNWRSVRFLGLISYSFYLVHHIIIEFFVAHTHIALLGRVIIALAVSLVFAATDYHFVDQPLAKWRAKINTNASKKSNSVQPASSSMA